MDTDEELSEGSSDADREEGDGEEGEMQGEEGQRKAGPGRKEVEWYDDAEDERTERWAVAQRGGRESDAILSCPACLSTVCIDCQRHETYRNQYRLMYAVGCKVRRDKVAWIASDPTAPQHRSASKRKRGCSRTGRLNDGQPEQGSIESGQGNAGKVEQLCAVQCEECGTEVAKLDEADVYHFFNVIPSYS